MDRSRLDVDRVRLLAFALSEDLSPFTGDEHTHIFHQLLYSAHGALHLSTSSGTWLLPPQRAAVIAAGVHHRVRATQPVSLRTVYISPSLLALEVPCNVFAASPLARELILYSMRWGADRSPDEALAEGYFRTLAGLAAEWLQETTDFYLPNPTSEALQAATSWLLENLEDATIERAAKAAHLSVRTLTRRFAEELSTTPRAWLQAARMLRAMDLLAMRGARVTEVALSVGFDSPSAFAAAFHEFAGETPRAYRSRRLDRVKSSETQSESARPYTP